MIVLMQVSQVVPLHITFNLYVMVVFVNLQIGECIYV